MIAIKEELIDELLKDYQKPEDIIGEDGLLKQLTKALLERAMNAELTSPVGIGLGFRRLTRGHICNGDLGVGNGCARRASYGARQHGASSLCLQWTRNREGKR